MECSVQGRPKKADTGEGQSQERACSSFSLTPRGMFKKNSFWQAIQSIPHTTVMVYVNYVKVCEDFTPNFGDKITGCRIMTRH
jgi:hypothetical protein